MMLVYLCIGLLLPFCFPCVARPISCPRSGSILFIGTPQRAGLFLLRHGDGVMVEMISYPKAVDV